MNFREILEEKLGTEADPATSLHPGNPTPRPRELGTADPAHLAFLLGTMRVRRFQPTPKHPFRPSNSQAHKPHSQPRQQQRPTQNQARPHHAAPKPRRAKGPAHQLTDRQKSATVWFEQKGAKLEPDFTQEELKQAFRALARKTHPDTGGDAQDFLTLKAHQATLKTVFRK